MELRTNILTSLLICTCLTLTACNTSDSDNKSASSDTPTSVDNSTGGSGTSGSTSGNSSSGGSTNGDTSSSNDDPAPAPIIIALSWQPTAGQIDGYIVHTGPSPESATSVLTVTASTAVEYDALDDLGLSVGDQACFRIKAYNTEGQSGYSDAVCYTVSTLT